MKRLLDWIRRILGLDHEDQAKPQGPGRYRLVTLCSNLPRAVMSMCRFQEGGWDELFMGMINRAGERSAIWAWNDGSGVGKPARHLLRCLHHYEGISDLYQAPDNGPLHILPESWGRGALDEVVYFSGELSPISHFIQDYSSLAPGVDWGAARLCPRTGRQFVMYGRTGRPGFIIHYHEGAWRKLAQTAGFPRTLVVLDDGSLLAGCWAGPVQRVFADGRVEDHVLHTPLGNPSHCFLWDDTANDLVWLLGKERRPLWAPRSDLTKFRDVRKFIPQGEGWQEVPQVEGNFMALTVHPLSKRAILMAGDPGQGSGFYEILPQGKNEMRAYQVARRGDIPQWSSNAACAYKKWAAFGTGIYQPHVKGDRTGGIVVGLEMR